MKVYVPAARERVRIRGYEAVFFVLTVYPERQTIDAVSLDGRAEAVEGVAFAALMPVAEGKEELPGGSAAE